ncbi:MAG TPA: ATP-binding cassette domain-containing protein, partial [Polyangiaceae bacterium]
PGVTVLFGPSGSGKSTTLAAIAGLSRPEAGRVALGSAIWFDAERGIDVPPDGRRLSLVFQSLALFPHLTALGNVAYGIDRALSRADRERRALRMLERMKVAHVAARRPATFSGGEAQRVALARAFAHEPRVLLLDEAFSAMDRDLRYELGADVRRVVAELGIPAILVTHHRMEARAVGERAVLVRDGQVDAIGPVRDVVPAPERERERD